VWRCFFRPICQWSVRHSVLLEFDIAAFTAFNDQIILSKQHQECPVHAERTRGGLW